MRVYLAQVEVARGSQRLSGFDFETIFMTSCVLFSIFVYFFGEKGFVHAVWYLDLDSCCVFFHFSMAFQHGCSVTLQLLFSMCWTWSRQRRRRGRRPHDVHVRCFEVHGTIHMTAAKSTTWSYLKRAWDNDLTFERASCSLAKTGFFEVIFGVFFW